MQQRFLRPSDAETLCDQAAVNASMKGPVGRPTAEESFGWHLNVSAPSRNILNVQAPFSRTYAMPGNYSCSHVYKVYLHYSTNEALLS